MSCGSHNDCGLKVDSGKESETSGVIEIGLGNLDSPTKTNHWTQLIERRMQASPQFKANKGEENPGINVCRLFRASTASVKSAIGLSRFINRTNVTTSGPNVDDEYRAMVEGVLVTTRFSREDAVKGIKKRLRKILG